MPITRLQIGMRSKLLQNYFSEDSPTRGVVLTSAIVAGYSPQKARQKQRKFEGWIAEESRKRQCRAEQNPANTRSPISGKLLPYQLVQSEELRREPSQGAVVSDGAVPGEDVLAAYRSPYSGGAVYFDLNGNEIRRVEPPGSWHQTYPSYTARPFRLEDFYPSWGPPPEPAREIDADDPLGNLDALPQGRLDPQEFTEIRFLRR